MQLHSPTYSERITTTVKSDFIVKPVKALAVLTTPPPSNTSASSPGLTVAKRQASSQDAPQAGRMISTDNYNSRNGANDSESDNDDDDAAANFRSQRSTDASPEPSAGTILDELMERKRTSSGSSGQSASHSSWNAGSEMSVNSSTERMKSGALSTASSRPPARASNQNIRAPQGIPGRDAAVAARNPIIPAASSSSCASSEPDMDTNPLRRLRDSQSGFSKAVFRPGVAARSEAKLPLNNLNANVSFFDKLKEQEQEGMQ